MREFFESLCLETARHCPHVHRIPSSRVEGCEGSGGPAVSFWGAAHPFSATGHPTRCVVSDPFLHANVRAHTRESGGPESVCCFQRERIPGDVSESVVACVIDVTFSCKGQALLSRLSEASIIRGVWGGFAFSFFPAVESSTT